jgi:zinc transporter ZupT
MKEPSEEEYIEPHCIGCSEDPVGELMKWQENADAEIKAMSDEATRASSSFLISNDSTIIVVSDEETAGMNVAPITEEEQKAQTLLSTTTNIVGSAKIAAADGDELDGMKQAKEETFQPPAVFRLSSIEEQKKLVKTGMTTAIAVAIHNFPEGLATFVAALHDPAAGVVLAIAIGAHNIPEGLCVSLPIYYATGKRWKAFMWGAISGMAEPVAAIMGWLVLANAVSDMVYAVLFALVSGMMIMISMKELLPTAHRYDPEDSVVTYSSIVGMGLMALSLVLFKSA